MACCGVKDMFDIFYVSPKPGCVSKNHVEEPFHPFAEQIDD